MSESTNNQDYSAAATSVSTVGISRFQNKIAIVTGAGSGIGRAIVVRLVAEGAVVLGIDVNEAGLEETVQLTVRPENVSIAVVSITDEQQVTEKVNEYITRQGRLDVLLNVAGILRVTSSTEVTLEEFKTVIDTNLIGTFLMCRICLPHLILTKGNIINTASTAAFFGHPYMAAYAASKGAIVALTKSLAREYILQGVRVNAIAPGGTVTPIHKAAVFPKDADLSIMSNLRMPNNRFGQPDEIAAVVAMLGSQDGSFINGEVIRIDGGVHS